MISARKNFHVSFSALLLLHAPHTPGTSELTVILVHDLAGALIGGIQLARRIGRKQKRIVPEIRSAQSRKVVSRLSDNRRDENERHGAKDRAKTHPQYVPISSVLTAPWPCGITLNSDR